MKQSMATKDKKKNYNSGKRNISYVAKVHKATDTSPTALSPSNSESAAAQPEPQPSDPQPVVQTAKTDQPIDQPYGKLMKQVMMKLYYVCSCRSLASENVKQLKDVYSEETITPESFKEFMLPMNKSIMPPRKAVLSNGYQEAKAKYGDFREGRRIDEDEPGNDDDQGIIPATDNSHSAISNAPSWFDTEIEPKDNAEIKGGQDGFMWENLASRQITLEEEKLRFNKESSKEGKKEEAGQVKVDVESIFSKIEGQLSYSSVDEKYEKIAQGSKIERELFAHANDTPNLNGLNINAIDGESLEAQMIKNAKVEPDDGEKEEKPAWEDFSAEEIKQHTQKHIEDWGLTLDQNKDALLQSNAKFGAQNGDNGMMGVYDRPIARETSMPMAAKFREEPNLSKPEIYAEPIRIESKNPFCHSSLNIKETDRVWYYEDTQRSLQGPFTSIEMYMWHKAGYFFSELPLRCGEYGSFTTMGEFLSSIQTKAKSRMEALPMQHFDSSNMNAFFDNGYGYREAVRPAMRNSPPLAPPVTSLEEIEHSQFRPEYGRYPEPQYRVPFPLERARSEPVQWNPAVPIGRYPPPTHAGVQPGYYPNYPGYEVYAAPQPGYAQVKQPYAGRGQYFEEDPAIASSRIGGPAEPSQPLNEGAYATDEASDLKALLGMQNNSNKALYR